MGILGTMGVWYANFKLASQRRWHLNRLKKVNRGTHVDIWGRIFQAEGMPVQRPRGRGMLVTYKEAVRKLEWSERG